MVMYDNCTLMIRHFPSDLSDNEKIDFLKHFGASEVKCLSSKYKKGNVAFARFESSSQAQAVLNRLHQKELLGQLLSVEYIRGSDTRNKLLSVKERCAEKKEDGPVQEKTYEDFLLKLNAWTNVTDFRQPPPAHLRYHYPPPDPLILTNMCKALAKVPKLYTQVLHLMNKMNLPCPLMEEFPIEADVVVVDAGSLERRHEADETEESELEEEADVRKELIPETSGLTRPSSKRPIKRPKLSLPTPVSRPKPAVDPSCVFDVAPREILPRKIELKVSADLTSLQASRTPQEQSVTVEHFEKILPPEKPAVTDEKPEEELYSGNTISDEELASNRISLRDQRMLPVFKNYQAGTPSCRLYIKNLAKTVILDNLHHIYRRYYNEQDEVQGIMYDVRLMQEGRMKGQAFVTLQSVAEAQRAVKETNGYILQGKPMVVQFARSSVHKPSDAASLSKLEDS